MMQYIALWTGKTIFSILRLLHRRGAALPGLIVERLFPHFLANTLAKIPEGVIIITGTNGKTTSTKMLTHVLRSEKKVLTNPTGSNFVRGIVASVIQHSSWSGGLPYDIAVFELDEAYAARFVRLFKPRVVVVLNVMRDQMDRFGEIDHTAKLITTVVKEATDFIILNRDDPRVFAMTETVKVPVYYFGVNQKLRSIYRNDDELHDDTVAVHKHQAATAVLEALSGGTATIILANKSLDIQLAAKGTYNAQNAVAVCAAAYLLGIDVDDIATTICDVKPAFGRGEDIHVGNKQVILQLVKNPGGFRHALLTGKDIAQAVTLIAINDDYADGRDISWLWDVSFSDGGVHGSVITSGSRAADMALRLRYDGISGQNSNDNLDNALDDSLASTPDGSILLIYATYTAMLHLRATLAKMTEVEAV